MTSNLEDDDAHAAGHEVPHEGKPIDPDAFGGSGDAQPADGREAWERGIDDSVSEVDRLAAELKEDLIWQRVMATDKAIAEWWARNLGQRPDQKTSESSGKRTTGLQPLWTPSETTFDFARTELVRLDILPSPSTWRDHSLVANSNPLHVDSAAGYGVGTFLNSVLGGGIDRGESLVLGASGPGAGKTYLIGQFAEGLALRCAAIIDNPAAWEPTTRTLTPVIILSELGWETLLGRAVARWTGLDVNVFRQGRHWEGYRINGARSERIDVATAQKIANEATGPSGSLAPLHDWMLRLPIELGSSPRDAVDRIKHEASTWASRLRAGGLHTGFDVVPVVMVDPIQRYQGAEDDEVKALNTLVECLHDAAVAEGFAVLCTSDSNKDSATGGAGKRAAGERESRERGVKFMRGSLKLQHIVSASLYLDRDWERALPKGFGELEVGISKNRNGAGGPPFARFRWHFATGRMFASTADYAAKAHKDSTPKKTEDTNAKTGHKTTDADIVDSKSVDQNKQRSFDERFGA